MKAYGSRLIVVEYEERSPAGSRIILPPGVEEYRVGIIESAGADVGPDLAEGAKVWFTSDCGVRFGDRTVIDHKCVLAWEGNDDQT